MTPAAELLLNRWMDAADQLGLLFAFEPDEKVAASLGKMRHNLNVEFCALFPKADPETIGAGVDSIVVAIQRRQREIEAVGATSRV
jgi:hypothetical protein